jgi:iron complex transport system substrate-binding protein
MGGPRTILAALTLVAFTLAACASDPTPSGPSAAPASSGAAFPVTVTGTNGSVAIDQRPTRIASLSPSATEDLFAIGAGDQVIAVDDQSNYPPGAPMTKLSGFEPNVEAIAGYQPDLVVYATETGGLGSSLKKLGIPALQLDAAATLDDVYAQIETLGKATGNAGDATKLADSMRSTVQGIVANADMSAGLSFYYELDDTYYSVTSNTFIGQLFTQLGLTNIADQAKKASSGYPQLSGEYIIASNPDLIFLADTKCCHQSATTVAARPGWKDIAAVRNGNVVALEDDVASRWGPRVVDLMKQIADAAAAAGQAAAA